MRILYCLFLAAALTYGAERATLTGKVADQDGRPVEHATVMVYEAGVRQGYSAFCPTCYTDCGKHTLTDAEGGFRIGGLSPDLLFTLLVVRPGYLPVWLAKVDPAKGPAENAVLKPRPPVPDVSQVVRGHVVDTHGKPVRDAIVEQRGVRFMRDGQVGTMFGGSKQGWIDPLAVADANGDFEIAYGKPVVGMLLTVRARGMATRLFTENTGAERRTMTISEGATVRGRLVHEGKPVSGAELGLTTRSRNSANYIPEVRIGTQPDGTFAFTNVPAGRIWLVYPKMDSLAARNLGAGPTPCETKDDGEMADVGDLLLKAGHTVRGRVVLSDGKPIPPGMRITLRADVDSQVAQLAPDGAFEFRGLATDVYDLMPAVKGYQIHGDIKEVLANRDITSVVITMKPAAGRP